MEHTLSSLSPLSSLLSPLPSHLFPLTSHLSPLTSSLSPLPSHLSPLTSPLSPLPSLLANRKIVAAVTWPVGHVNPLEIMLVDGLINRQVKVTQ